MLESSDQSPELARISNPKTLAKLGYIKFDLNNGLAENGKSICLISDEEKFILNTLRNIFKNEFPKKFKLKVNDLLIKFTK